MPVPYASPPTRYHTCGQQLLLGSRHTGYQLMPVFKDPGTAPFREVTVCPSCGGRLRTTELSRRRPDAPEQERTA